MEPLRPADPRTVGPWQLLNRIGSGGMGVVFMAQRGTQLAALKVVRDSYLDDANARARFKREVNTLRRVSGPFVAAIIDADMDANPAWIASEFVEGPDLKAHVDVHGAMQPAQWELLAAGLLLALAAVHAAGVVHRDIKPANVLLAKDGPKLIDFGIAQAGDATVLTTTGLAVGSPAWMAPEQVEAKVVGPAADVFCAGSVLLFAATGRAPWGTGSIAEVMGQIAVAQPDLRALSERQQRLLSGLLEKNPARRPSAAQAAQLLTDTTSGAGATQVVVAGWAGVKLGDGRNFSKPESPPPLGEKGSGRPYMSGYFLGWTVKGWLINVLLVLLLSALFLMVFFSVVRGEWQKIPAQSAPVVPTTETFADGSTYTGAWQGGKPDGYGTYLYADGGMYTGDFKDGKRHDQGNYKGIDGTTYIGAWKDDKRNGFGTETYADGSTYTGEFVDGVRNEQGSETYAYGTPYTGALQGGKPDGYGTYIYANGGEYTGDFHDGQRNGQGTMRYADGTTYTGEWKDGTRNGQGTETAANGDTRTGWWWEGELVP